MKTLNLPTYSFKIKSEGDRKLIFDAFRKKYIVLTPEEWVRQNFAMFLVNERHFPASRIVMEKALTYNKMYKRCDILIYDNYANPNLLVECKAPEIAVDEKVFQQISVYNLVFKVKFLVVTNGINHYACAVDFETRKVKFLEDIPDFKHISANPIH